MGLLSGIPWIFGILLIIYSVESEQIYGLRPPTSRTHFFTPPRNQEQALGQGRRTSRLTNSRTFGINAKSNPGSEFDCPEEFGYYPHPSDCTQYYVCVFGGALLESCTGGLMYSQELQTCDWPRNVGCEVVDGTSQQSISQPQTSRDVTPRVPQVKQQIQQQQPQQQIQQQQQQQQPQRVRYQQISTPAPQQIQQSQLQQQQQRPLSRQQQIQSIPPPPEFPIAPNPIITSRGQPKLLDSQEDIAKLYAEAHETLPPAEEEENDRQQRVYRGQPSTLGQVQRDRDGIIHHANVNALPNHGKIGSYAFGSQVNQYSTTPQPSNIFVQQPQRQKPVAEHNTRNYYNASNQSYDPASYDSFYSVYDDDVELYRDVEYNNQQQQQQPQYNTQRGKPQQAIQSTYRPEVITTPTPQVPVRETYVSKQQQPVQQQQQYEQPSLAYNSEYDDALIAQIQEDHGFNQPTRNPVRGDRNDINSITDSYITSTTRTTEPTRFSPFPQYVEPTTTTTIRYRPTTTQSTTPSTTTTRATTPTTTKTTTTTTAATTTTTTTTTPTPTRSRTASTTTEQTTIASTQSTKPARTRTRGGSHYNSGSDRDQAAPVTSNRGTHPPRSRPTLKPKGTIVSKAVEFVDIYKNPPTRPDPLYPQPTPDKTAAKCRKDVCLLPDCSCGGKDIPGGLAPKDTPQIVLITFDDAVSELNEEYYIELFQTGRKNPNGCPLTATFYVSHEWTDYSKIQNLYSDGHEMASHTISHSFGEQFSQKKWTREIAGQREILSAYGGVKLSDVRGMRAPFLSIGGNKMFKMLYDSNFTYDSSMPVYENRPPSWPYTMDYKIFHDCMIPPCPTKSYPGVWEVPMVMWQDLNGGRCSMGDACANPSESEGVTKMLMKNFDRHYSTNRAPFGLFYHAAWFTQPHHKAGFIKFLDTINAMEDVWIITNWQALQWVRDPTPLSRINQFQPFQCDYSDRPKRCNNPKVCNLWHKSGVRYMRTCQPCPDIYPWTGKTGIRSSRIDNEIEE